MKMVRAILVTMRLSVDEVRRRWFALRMTQQMVRYGCDESKSCRIRPECHMTVNGWTGRLAGRPADCRADGGCRGPGRGVSQNTKEKAHRISGGFASGLMFTSSSRIAPL